MGYAGGTKEHPTYHNLGDHTETFQVDYDPDRLDYRDLLELFWQSHDPWRGSRSRQYMSLVLYHDETQKQVIQKSVENLQEGRGRQIETRVGSLDTFYRAEDYHQKHRLRQHTSLMQAFEDYSSRELTDSTAAARLNGLVAGYGRSGENRLDLESLGLPPEAHRSAEALMA